MKKFLLSFLILVPGLLFAGATGDGMGNHKARKTLDMNNNEIVNSPNFDSVATGTSTLNNLLTGLAGTRKRWFFTLNDDMESVPQYYLTRSTVPATPRTMKRILDGTSITDPIFVSTWVINIGTQLTIPAGQWICEMYSTMSAGTSNLVFVVYDGSGTAMNYTNIIGTTGIVLNTNNNRQWSDMEKIAYFEKESYTLKSKYLSVSLIAYENNTLLRTMYWSAGGNYDAHIILPAILSEITVTSVNGQTGAVTDIATTGELRISSTTLLVMASTSGAKADAIAGDYVPKASVLASTGVSAGAFCFFGSTDTTGDNQVSTVTVYCPVSLNVTDWNISCDVAGSCVVRISTKEFGGAFGVIDGGASIDNTKRPNSAGQPVSSGTSAGWTFRNIGAGGFVEFVLLSASTVRSFTISLIGKK